MTSQFGFGRTVVAAVLVAVALFVMAGSAMAQGLYYKEITKDGRIYVFNDEKNAVAFEKSGEMGKSVTLPGGGKDGETLIGDSETALQLYFLKHDMSVSVPLPPPPAPPAPAPFKLSGLMFGDYYYVANSNTATFDKQQGFWLRRAYFTYDHTFSPTVSARFRLEANSNGKMTSPTAAITPYVKDAWVKWMYNGRQAVSVGIQPTATFDWIENFYGLRHIEKTPLDLYRVDSSRDFGVSLTGPLDAANTFQYTLQYANDSGSNSEIDKYKTFRGEIRYVTNPGLVAEGFYSYHWRALDANRFIGQFFVGYQNPQTKVGFQYSHQTRHPANTVVGGTDTTINIWSGFANYFVQPNKFTLFARFDKSDVNPDVNGIDYLPINNKMPFTLGIFGFEYYVHANVRFSPNVEWVHYGTAPTGVTPPAKTNEATFRLTWFVSW